MISKPLLNFLIVCFWASIAIIALQVIEVYRAFSQLHSGVVPEPLVTLKGVYFLLFTLWMFLFFYSLFFFYKYDRYSKSGLFFLFFHAAYALVYFYRVIWHQKRELVGSYEREPVLGNTIFLETEEEEDDDEV